MHGSGATLSARRRPMYVYTMGTVDCYGARLRKCVEWEPGVISALSLGLVVEYMRVEQFRAP